MQWQWTTSSIVLLTTSGLSLVVAFSLFRRRLIPGASALALAMLAISEWALVAGLEAAAVPIDRKILFSTFEYIGMPSAAVLLLLFASRFTHHTAWMTTPHVAALWLLPIAAVAIAATNGFHGLLWTGFTPGPAGTNTLIYGHGPAFFACLAWIYILVFIASAFLIASALRASTVQRRQSMTILFGILFPWLSGILYALDITIVPGLNLAPVSFVLTGTIFAIGILPLRLFELIPVARDLLIDGMTDGVLVVDAGRRIVDINAAARRILSLPSSVIGDDAATALSAWPQLTQAFGGEDERRIELTLSEDPLLHVDLRIVQLKRASGVAAGVLVDIRDISERYRVERALQNANDRLHLQLQQIERLQDELRERAIRDTLTGLYNRRHLDDVLPRILERAIQDTTPVAVILFDIDHFKRVNDTYGHLVGDALLEKLGRLLASHTRAADIACRYGGEEFLLILPDASLEVAVERAEALREGFQAVRLPELGGKHPPTLSAGIAAAPQHGTTQDDLVRAADAALYRSKGAGRDCIRTAVAPPHPRSSGPLSA